MKICAHGECESEGAMLPAASFYLNNRRLSTHCMDCTKKQKRSDYLESRERIIEPFIIRKSMAITAIKNELGKITNHNNGLNELRTSESESKIYTYAHCYLDDCTATAKKLLRVLVRISQVPR